MDTIELFPNATTYDPGADIYYVPFITEDGRVGYQVGRTDDRPDAETFIYFAPSSNGREAPDDPNVFVYIGQDNDPAHDKPQHFYELGPKDFGLEAA